jgi:hypothetical protein
MLLVAKPVKAFSLVNLTLVQDRDRVGLDEPGQARDISFGISHQQVSEHVTIMLLA